MLKIEKDRDNKIELRKYSMKINGRLISSLDSLRVNFDFIEIWNRKEIAIRDLSPVHIYYPSQELLAYYEGFSHPEVVVNKDGNLFVRLNDKDIKISLDLDNKLLEQFQILDKIRILSLHKLAGHSITAVNIDMIDDSIPETSHEIHLKNGKSIKYGNNTNDQSPLTHKAIFVADNSQKNSMVGKYSLSSGECTYGIFQGSNLIDVVPPHSSNASYRLTYEQCNDKIYLIVTDVATDTCVAEYRNAHYYALLGDKDFIVINGLMVTCFHDEDLNNRLRQYVVKAKSPERLIVNDSHIIIVYKDNTIETIQL